MKILIETTEGGVNLSVDSETTVVEVVGILEIAKSTLTMSNGDVEVKEKE